MIHTHKTAIAIPNEDFKQIEILRKETGKSRSRLLIDAFHVWRNLQKKESQERLYELAYRRKPENLSEITAGMKAGLALWEKENW
jgi:hypothetical protein